MQQYADFKTIFLASNSMNGFQSYFEDFHDCENGWYTYIIKGGPGTGKSTAMKTVAKTLKEKGLDVIVGPCSSDPYSLDAVIVPEKKAVIFDGTAPHVVEPSFVGACDKIVNFGDAFDFKKLISSKEQIIQISNSISNTYKRIYRYTSVLGALKKDNLKFAKQTTDIEAAEKFAFSLIKKYIPKNNGVGIEKGCFLSALTFKGYIAFADTVKHFADTVISVCDDFGFVSDLIMQKVKTAAKNNGYDIYVCYNPLLPEKIDHIIIPYLKLAFITEGKELSFNYVTRRTHAKRFTDLEILNSNKEKIAFNRRAYRKIADQTVTVMEEAKKLHDDLEALYIPAVDFKKTEKIANNLINDISAI